MRSAYRTAFSLNEWATVMGLNSWIMAQFKKKSLSSNQPMYSRHRPAHLECDDVWYERIHHNGKPSRYEVSRAIADAEEAFVRVLGYFPAPTYQTIEMEYPGHWNPQVSSRGFQWNVRGEPKCITLPFKNLIELGSPVETEAAANHALQLVDDDGDGIYDYLTSTLSITIPDTVEDWQILARYPTAAADPDDNLSIFKDPLEWEIRPLRIIQTGADAIAGTRDIQIAFPAYCGVRWKQWDIDFPEPLIADDTSVYLTAVNVYYITTDSCLQGKFLWNGLDCAVTEAVACFNVNDKGHAEVCPVQRDPCGTEITLLDACNANGRKPDRVQINYLSGIPRLPDGRMDRLTAQIISWLTAGRLQCAPCGCGCGCTDCLDGAGRQRPLHWFSEVALVDGINATFLAYSRDDMNNPFGPTNGDVKAWKIAKQMSKTEMGVSFN